MLDKVYYKNECEVMLIFTHRSAVTLYHSEGKVMELLDEFLAPLGSDCITLSEFKNRVKIAEEDTVIIDIEEVA